MNFSLNSQQAKGLANFFFDMAKGLLLGGVGSAIISPEAKLLIAGLMTIFAAGCLKIALFLLEGVR